VNLKCLVYIIAHESHVNNVIDEPNKMILLTDYILFFWYFLFPRF